MAKQSKRPLMELPPPEQYTVGWLIAEFERSIEGITAAAELSKATKTFVATAFPNASVGINQIVVAQLADLPALFGLLSLDVHPGNLAGLREWFEDKLPSLAACCSKFASHSSKFVNTGSNAAFNAPAKQRNLPYLCSATVSSSVQTSYFGKTPPTGRHPTYMPAML